MATNFFTEILKTGITDMVIQIVKTENIVSVILTPKTKSKDSENQSYVPIVIKANSPEEIDEIFLETVLKPLEKTAISFSNIEQFEKNIESVEKDKLDKNKVYRRIIILILHGGAGHRDLHHAP